MIHWLIFWMFKLITAFSFAYPYKGEFGEIDRVSNISPEDFLTKYLSVGKPVIITDATKNLTAEQKKFWKVSELFQTSWFPEMVEMGRKSVEGEQLEKLLREMLPKPYFFNWKGETIPDDIYEIFYFGQKGISTAPHVDTGCGHSYQTQLDGVKLWHFWPFPTHRPLSYNNIHYDPKPLRGIAYEGDTVVFTPGWVHSTHALEAPSLAVSVYWRHPNPEFDSISYNEQVLDDLLSTRHYCNCRNRWQDKEKVSLFQKIWDMNCAIDRALFGGGATVITDYGFTFNYVGLGAKILSLILLLFLGFLFVDYYRRESWRRIINFYSFGLLIMFVFDVYLMYLLFDEKDIEPISEILGEIDFIGY